jgi:hypothetical protein
MAGGPILLDSRSICLDRLSADYADYADLQRKCADKLQGSLVVNASNLRNLRNLRITESQLCYCRERRVRVNLLTQSPSAHSIQNEPATHCHFRKT